MMRNSLLSVIFSLSSAAAIILLGITLIGLLTIHTGHGDASNSQGFLFFIPLEIALVGLSVLLASMLHKEN